MAIFNFLHNTSIENQSYHGNQTIEIINTKSVKANMMKISTSLSPKEHMVSEEIFFLVFFFFLLFFFLHFGFHGNQWK